MKKKINQILDKEVNFEIYLLPSLIAASFVLRILSAYFLKDFYIENEWSTLLNNLVNHKSYSYYTFDGELIPTVLLPPVYAFFLFFLKFIFPFEQNNFLYLIIFIQIVLSTYSIYLFYKINQNFFTSKLALVNSIIFSILPLNIYASGQISSITIQIFLSLFFLRSLLFIIKKQNIKNITVFSIISGLLILTRGEFILIFMVITLFIFFKKKIELVNLIKIFIIVILIISPYVVRNYIHFNQIIIVKSLGYNLWKGNNQFSKVAGYETISRKEFKLLDNKINNIDKNKYYEINRDDIFLAEAISNLKKDPIHYINLFFKKFLSYYFIDLDSDYPKYYNLFHIIPIIILSVFSFPGLLIFLKQKKLENKCLSLYLFLNLLIFSIFFILPRYKLIIIPIQIIFLGYFINYIINKLSREKIRNEY